MAVSADDCARNCGSGRHAVPTDGYDAKSRRADVT